MRCDNPRIGYNPLITITHDESPVFEPLAVVPDPIALPLLPAVDHYIATPLAELLALDHLPELLVAHRLRLNPHQRIAPQYLLATLPLPLQLSRLGFDRLVLLDRISRTDHHAVAHLKVTQQRVGLAVYVAGEVVDVEGVVNRKHSLHFNVI